MGRVPIFTTISWGSSAQNHSAGPLYVTYTFKKNLRLLSKAKTQMASGQGSHWFIESPEMFHLCVTRPPEICVNLVFKYIHAASISTICKFHSFIEYFLIFNLYWSFTNDTSCPLVLLSFLSEKKIFLSIFSYPFNI